MRTSRSDVLADRSKAREQEIAKAEHQAKVELVSKIIQLFDTKGHSQHCHFLPVAHFRGPLSPFSFFI